jgi:hypothetical protein
MRSSAAQLAAAILTLAGITLVCLHPLARHPCDVLVGPQRGGANDLTDYFIPIHTFPRQCMADFGQWPLWNPYRSCGVPHMGNPQSALFYPPNWLCWLWDPAHVLSWLLVAHHWFAGVGCYLLCRRYAFGWLASVGGGSFFLAAPYLIAQTGEGHYAQICGAAWMPWTILAYERLRAGSRGAIAGMAAMLAMIFFAGHQQELYYLILILTAWVIAGAITRWRAGEPRESRKLLLGWALVGLTTLGLVAVDLVPITVYLRQMARAEGLTAVNAGKISMSLPNLLQLLNPFALGGPDSYGGGDKFFWESLCSFGIVPLVLAIFGLATARRSYPVARMAWTCLVALAFAFGSHGPLFRILYAIVPGMTMFRVPSRVMFFCSLAVAVLAGAGLQSLQLGAREWSERRRLVIRRVLLGGAIPCVLALVFCKLVPALVARDGGQSNREPDVAAEPAGHQPQSAPDVRQAIVRRALEKSVAKRSSYGWLLGSLAFVYAGVWRRELARAAVIGLGLVSVVQLAGYANKLLISLAPADLDVMRTAADFIQIQRHPRDGRILCTQAFLPDRLAQLRRIAKVQVYEPLPLARYADYFVALTGKSDPTSDLIGAASPDPDKMRERLLDVANVRAVVMLTNRSKPPPDDFHWKEMAMSTGERSLRWRGMASRNFESVFANTDALPRAFVVGDAKVLSPGSNAIAAIGELRPRDEVLVETDSLSPGPRANFSVATIVEDTPTRIVIETDLAAPGYLVLSDTWYPGWTATDNDQPVPVVPANVAFRAVALPAGNHHVVFLFRIQGWWIGAIVSGIVWTSLFALRFASLPPRIRGLISRRAGPCTQPARPNRPAPARTTSVRPSRLPSHASRSTGRVERRGAAAGETCPPRAPSETSSPPAVARGRPNLQTKIAPRVAG